MKTMVSELEEETLSDFPPEDRPRRRLISLVLIAAVVAAIAIFAVGRIRAAMRPADQTQYKVATVATGTVRKTVSATGILQPWSTVDIKSKAGGRVNALLVDVGSVVHTGQILARIDPTDTLLTVQTARAGINGALAHTRQAAATYQLQSQQSRIAVENAQAALEAALAAQGSAAAQYASARGQAAAQPQLTASAVQQSRANYNQALRTREALNATDPQDRAAAQAAYDQALANQKAAKAALDRQTRLAEKGFVAQQTVDTDQASYDVYVAQTQSAHEKLNTLQAQQQANDANADAKVAQAKAALVNAQSAVDVATRRAAARQAAAALRQANAQVDEARVAVSQARANIANNAIKKYDIAYNNAQIASQQATLTNADTTLAQTVVRAPTSGVVLTKNVSQGTYITSGESLNSVGATIVTLGDVSRMFVQATVDETDLATVDVGQDVDVSFDAYPGIPFQGKVARVDPQAVVNQNVTQFDVRVEIDNSSPTFRLLKPGMNATCDFIADKKDNVLSVPNEAVQTDDQGATYVQVATGGKPAPADPVLGTTADPNTLVGVKLQRRDVQVGLAGNDTTEIKGGLKEGERVVTQTITPVAPTAAAPAGNSPFGGGRGPGGFGGGRGGGR